jgi:hypothetical protein
MVIRRRPALSAKPLSLRVGAVALCALESVLFDTRVLWPLILVVCVGIVAVTTIVGLLLPIPLTVVRTNLSAQELNGSRHGVRVVST